MHEHKEPKPCKHELKHCQKCDVVYCEKCKNEWRKTSYTISIPSIWTDDGSYESGTITTTNHPITYTIAGNCGHNQ